MTTVIFLGPTLPRDEALHLLPGADIRPPAQAGDVYRAVAHDAATTIVLVDGVFGTVPSVWHKEILFALSRQCAVLGSSSMGALRAAECADFGMQGVGKVFEMYARGELEDDDEVAVSHLDADAGYKPLSVPMVNLRFAASQARARDIAPTEALVEFLDAAKAIFYPERTWEILADQLGGPAWVDEFLSFAQQPEHNLKALDARQLLHGLREHQASAGPGDRDVEGAGVVLEETAFWHRLRREADFPAVTPWFEDVRGGVSMASRVDAVRRTLLDPADPRLGLNARLWVHLVQTAADMLGIAPTKADVQERSNEFRREHGLLDAAATHAWLSKRQLSVVEWRRTLEFQVKAEQLKAEFVGELRAHVPLLIALDGGWSRLAASDTEGSVPHADGGADDDLEVIQHLFARPGMPRAGDLDSFAARLGFTSMTELIATAGRVSPAPSVGGQPRIDSSDPGEDSPVEMA